MTPEGAHSDSPWRLRPSRAEDIDALTAAHVALFPVDYDRDFFVQLCTGGGGIGCIVAFEAPRRGEGGAAPELAGFVAFTTCTLASLDPGDSKLMSHMLGIGGPAPRHEATQVLYILSLGVLPPHRRRGLASRLIAAAVDAPPSAAAAAVFLHVAAYNHGAHQLYLRLGFRIVNQHQDFYVVNAARAPDPGRRNYDAYVFARRCDRGGGPRPAAAAPAECRLDLGWRGGGPHSRLARGSGWPPPCRDACLSLPGAICGLPGALLQRVASVCGLLAYPAPRRTSSSEGLADVGAGSSDVAVLGGSGPSAAMRRPSCATWPRESEGGGCCHDDLPASADFAGVANAGENCACGGSGGSRMGQSLCGQSRLPGMPQPGRSVSGTPNSHSSAKLAVPAAADRSQAGGHEIHAYRQLFRPTLHSSRVV